MIEDVWTPLPVEKVGIVSDSHGQADATTRAVDALLEGGAELILHLGDIGGEAVVDRLVGLPARILLGNVDDPRLADYARSLDVIVDDPVFYGLIGGRRVSATHGHREDVLSHLLTLSPEIVLHGHTHQWRDEQRANIRFVNPGAIFRTTRPSAALLSPRTGRIDRFELEMDGTVRRIPFPPHGEPDSRCSCS